MTRPYEHVPSEELQAAYLRQFDQVQQLIRDHYSSIAGPARRNLNRMAKELHRRNDRD